MDKQAILIGPHAQWPTGYSSVSEMMIYVAKHYPEKGLTYLLPDGSEKRVSYHQHVIHAKSMLKAMQDNGLKKGDHVLLVINDPQKFYIAFWACIIGGFVAIPLAEPTSYEVGSIGFRRVEKIWEDNQAGYVVITKAQESEVVELKKEKGFEKFSYLCVEEITGQQPDCNIPKVHNDDVIFIQYSSGSTGKPKGILLTNENVMENVTSLTHAFESHEKEKTFCWLPQNHNMGIFGQHLVSVMVGSDQFIMASYNFIRNPYLFLKKISDHKGNWFAASNFAFEWMEKKITPEQVKNLDLSSVVKAYNGADPISLSVVDSFLKKFGKAGFSKAAMKPAYGLSECTLAATATMLDTSYYCENVNRNIMATEQRATQVVNENEIQLTRMVGVGTPIHNVTVRVCDENNRVLKQREIGEIQISGRLISQGYYTKDSIIPIVNEEGFLPTGDVGYIVDEGVIITGRIKDVIVIRGKNYISSDFEEAIFGELGIPRGNIAVTSSFSEQKGYEELLVFIEWDKDLSSFLPVIAIVKKEVLKRFGLEAEFVIPTQNFPRTSTGKIQRFALKKQYENQDYQSVIKQIERDTKHETEPLTSKEKVKSEEIQAIWGKIFNIPESQIDLEASFLETGGTSVRAYEFLGMLSEMTGTEIPSSIFLKCETLGEFIEYFDDVSLQEEITPEQTEGFEKKHSGETVVITGMALKFPEAENAEQFWNNLYMGKDSIKHVSEARRQLLNLPEWNDWLGEISDVDSFDYEFFNIALEEARVMDPQHRISLELAYQALEDAGAINDVESEKNFATYAATSFNSYMPIVFEAIKKGVEIHPKTLVRNLNNVIAAEISHKFNMIGPSMALDTACSSFLAATHQARKIIMSGEVDGAVVTGSFLMLNDMIHHLAEKGGILSSGNQSKVFDVDADGSTLGEGCIVIVLEKESVAISKNKHIYGKILGSAINNDGYALSIMAPNPQGQYKVLKEAYHDAGISPYNLGLYEAHGTGTEIGDPIEVNALAKLFSEYQKEEKTIGIGSVKTNIGHLLPVAGGAGLAKVLLSMMHHKIPPSLNINQLNPKLLMEQTPLSVIIEAQPWLQEKKYGAVNSLGLGGTNVHMVIEKDADIIKPSAKNSHYVITVSAKNEKSLLPQIENLKVYIASNKHNIHNIAYTRNCKRPHYDCRAVAIYDKSGECVQNFKIDQKIKFGTVKAVLIINGTKNVGTFDKLEQLISISECLGEHIKIYTTVESHALNRLGIEFLSEKKAKTLKTDIIIHFEKVQETSIQYKKLIIFPKSNSDFVYENLLASLYLAGVDPNWENVYDEKHHSTLPLPEYQFKKNKVWLN